MFFQNKNFKFQTDCNSIKALSQLVLAVSVLVIVLSFMLYLARPLIEAYLQS